MHFGKRSTPPCIDCDGDQCTMNCGPSVSGAASGVAVDYTPAVVAIQPAVSEHVTERLVALLYVLMRDEMPMGRLVDIIQDKVLRPSPVLYSPELEALARRYASAITEKAGSR